MTNVIAFPAHRTRRPFFDRAAISEAELAEARRMLTEFAFGEGLESLPSAEVIDLAQKRTARRGAATGPALPTAGATALAAETIALAEPGEPARAGADLRREAEPSVRRSAEVIDLTERLAAR